MDINPIFFYVFAGLAIAFSLAVILLKSPVSSAFSLVMVFFVFAGIYALLDAHLIATLQVLVYAGAVMVLFVFVIMLLNADAPSFDLGRSHIALRIASVIGACILLGAFFAVFKNRTPAIPMGLMTAQHVAELGGNTAVISRTLFSDYLLPFELTSVLLLGAIVATVSIAKRKMENPK